jgi:hypothetical protein
VKAEIIPELFLMNRGRLFADRAEVQHVPEAGITVAVADAGEPASAAASA